MTPWFRGDFFLILLTHTKTFSSSLTLRLCCTEAASRYSSKGCFHYVLFINFGLHILFGDYVMCGCFSESQLFECIQMCVRVCALQCVCVCRCQGNDPGDTWTFWKHSGGCMALIIFCFPSIQSCILGLLANCLVIHLIVLYCTGSHV